MSDKWLKDALWQGEGLFDKVSDVILARHEKYGPGNIARHGLEGVLVRLDDKIERLAHSKEDHSDESYRDAWMDIVGYGLIALLWLDGKWPGSPKPNRGRPTVLNMDDTEFLD